MWWALLFLVIAPLSVYPQNRSTRKPDPERDGMLSKVGDGYKFATGITWAREGFLVFSDTPSGRVLRVSPEGTQVLRDGLNGPQGIAVDAEGRVYICETRGRRVVRLDKRGKLEVLAERWEGKRLNGPNEITLAKNGHVYFSDPAFGTADDSRELPFYGVYHVASKGEVQLVTKTSGRPNGLAFSPDGNTLYVADSDARSVLAFDIDKRGTASNERVLISGIDGVPDGLHVDKEGRIYVAARHLLVFTADGKQIHSIPIAEKPSAIALGDGDLGTLYIAARSSLYRFRPEPEARH